MALSGWQLSDPHTLGGPVLCTDYDAFVADLFGRVNSMRTLTILAFVQTGLLLVLLGKLFVPDDELAVNSGHKHSEAATRQRTVSEGSSNVQFAARSPDRDDDRLREIIREELAALADKLGASAGQAPINVALESVVTPESLYRREEVLGQIEYYSSVGSISNMEMQRLQGEIAKLDKKSAQEMLKELVGALNSGELKGEL